MNTEPKQTAGYGPTLEQTTTDDLVQVMWSGTRTMAVLEPDPDAMDLWVICRALARLPRFNALSDRAVTVGHHLHICMNALPHFTPGDADDLDMDWLRRAVLLHDFPEAYLGDLIHPLKTLPDMAAFRQLDDRYAAVIGDLWNPAATDAAVRTRDSVFPRVMWNVDAYARSAEVNAVMPAAGVSHFARCDAGYFHVAREHIDHARDVVSWSSRRTARSLWDLCLRHGIDPGGAATDDSGPPPEQRAGTLAHLSDWPPDHPDRQT